MVNQVGQKTNSFIEIGVQPPQQLNFVLVHAKCAKKNKIKCKDLKKMIVKRKEFAPLFFLFIMCKCKCKYYQLDVVVKVSKFLKQDTETQ